jgi:hypothetical protein
LDGRLLGQRLAFSPNFRGGVFVAAGDLNGDGRDDVVAGAGPGGTPHVRAINVANMGLFSNFFAFSPNFSGGVRVTTGDLTGDGLEDIIVGAGPGALPVVRAFLPSGEILGETLAFSARFRGGVFVGAGDIDADGLAEVAVGTGGGSRPLVRLFRSNGAFLGQTLVFNGTFPGGVRVAVSDLAEDGASELIVGAGPGGGPLVQVIDPLTGDFLLSRFAFGRNFRGGVFVG